MKTHISNLALVLILAGVSGSCSSTDVAHDAGAPGEGRGVLQTIGTQFQRLVAPTANQHPSSVPSRQPFFSEPWPASFEAGVDGSLSARAHDDAPSARSGLAPVRDRGRLVERAGFHPATGGARRTDPLALRFPATAAGELRVELGTTWIEERLVGATRAAPAEVVDGRVVYAGAKRGIDRIYEVSGQRIEEYLRIADPRAASDLSYEVVTGPDIADLVADGSGFGLVAIDAAGAPMLNAPQPRGVDAHGAPVLGRLVAARMGDHRFSIRVELLADSPSFPVLLDPSWVTTGSMTSRRTTFAATTLPTGKVLVTGGYDGVTGVASAELYDPVTGTWSATGAMATARSFHTSTLLPNGKVLLAGDPSLLGSAELYDPAAGTFTATGSMAVGRFNHTATVLPNGKVLIAGGTASNKASSELYDPATGTFSATGFMATGRERHTATLLPTGKVLVVGGVSAFTSAELYDPALGTWSTTASLPLPGRYSHTATLLANGLVLVAAGAPSGVGNGLPTAELYNPASGTWSATGALTNGRFVHTATLLLNGKVLVVGGINASGLLASAELYDATTGAWSATGSLATARDNHTAALLLNGGVVVQGGYDGAYLSSAELYLELLGDPCTLPSDCASGFCTDGVCCDTACGSGANDCQACSVAAGAAVSGTCGLLASTRTCRPGAGACDLPETCTGASPTCPADSFQSSATTCRASAGVCDPPETCTGSAAACPANAFAPSTTSCRAAAGGCDVEEMCTGTAAACPGDSFQPSTTTCRVSAGGCDLVENCTGAASACPTDLYEEIETACRPSAGPCDATESCSGASGSCPPDTFRPSTSSCRAAAGPCDAVETCTGASAACPDDELLPSTAECRAAAGICDLAERCDGTSVACPDNAFQPPLMPVAACDQYVCSGSINCLSACTDDMMCATGFRCEQGACLPQDSGEPVGCGCGASSPGGPFLPLALLAFALRRPGRRRRARLATRI